MSTRPYLSVVATARNDDHGGDPLYRTQLFINGLAAQAERFAMDVELVLVEWNPPLDRPRLADVLDWPQSSRLVVRIIEVPEELHATLDFADRLPLFQMIGKNVGIRRARGEFVLATNIDILFSDELMRYVAGGRLERRRVYTADRYDVPAELDPADTIEQQLAQARRTAIRIHRREGTLDLRDGRFYRIYPRVSLRAGLRNSNVGAFLYRSRAARVSGLSWLVLAQAAPRRGHPASPHRYSGARAVRLRRAGIWLRSTYHRCYAFAYWLVAGFNDPRKVPTRILKLVHRLDAAVVTGSGGGGSFGTGVVPTSRAATFALLPVRLAVGALRLAKARWAETQLSVIDELARIRLHTNACGDFTLMSFDDWIATGGYAEYEMYSMHIDGLQLYIAHYHGIEESLLPFPIYHIEHGGGFRPEAKGDESLDASLTRRTIPQISNAQLLALIRQMYEEGAPLAPNGSDWGFASAELVEIHPQEPVAPAVTAIRGGDE